MISLLVLAQLTIGSIALKPADYLDGRAIAGGTGAPVVMLTLTSSAAKRIATSGPVLLDGAAVVTRVTDGVIEIDGQPDFAAAKALADAMRGRYLGLPYAGAQAISAAVLAQTQASR